MVEFEVIEVEYSAAELERRAERKRKRDREWERNNRGRRAEQARNRYRYNNYRTCPGTEDDPICVVVLTSSRCIRCDYHSHEREKALRRAASHEKKELASA